MKKKCKTSVTTCCVFKIPSQIGLQQKLTSCTWRDTANLLPAQCNQIVRLFFNIWPFATMKTSPIMSQICQSRLSILPNRKWTVKNLPKICKVLPIWWKFAKSGHTARRPVSVLLHLYFSQDTNRFPVLIHCPKIWAKLGLFLFIFVLFSIQWQI